MAGGVQGGVNVPVTADISGLQSGLQKAKGEVQRFGQTVATQSRGTASGGGGAGGRLTGQGYSSIGFGDFARGALSRMGGPLSAFGGIGSAATIGGGVLAGGYAATSAISKAADVSREAQNSAYGIGVSVSAFTRMDTAARRAGLSTEMLKQSLTQFRDISRSAAMGDSRSSALLSSLGIKANSGMTTEQQLDTTIKNLDKLGSAKERVAVQLFGAQGSRMAGALANQRAGGLTDEQASFFSERGGALAGIGSDIKNGMMSGMANAAMYIYDRVNIGEGSWWNGGAPGDARRKRAKEEADAAARGEMDKFREQEAKGIADASKGPKQLFDEMDWKISELQKNFAFDPANGERNEWLADRASAKNFFQYRESLQRTPGEKFKDRSAEIALQYKNNQIDKEQAARMMLNEQRSYLSEVMPSGAAPSAGTDTAAGFALVVGAQQQASMRANRLEGLQGVIQRAFGGSAGSILREMGAQMGWYRQQLIDI